MFKRNTMLFAYFSSVNIAGTFIVFFLLRNDNGSLTGTAAAVGSVGLLVLYLAQWKFAVKSFLLEKINRLLEQLELGEHKLGQGTRTPYSITIAEEKVKSGKHFDEYVTVVTVQGWVYSSQDFSYRILDASPAEVQQMTLDRLSSDRSFTVDVDSIKRSIFPRSTVRLYELRRLAAILYDALQRQNHFTPV